MLHFQVLDGIAEHLVISPLLPDIQVNPVPILAVLGVSLPVRPPKHHHLQTRTDDHQQAGAARNPHPLPVIRLVCLWEDVRAQHRSTLSHRGQDGQPRGSLRVGRVRVGHPGENESDADEDLCGEEETKVSGCDARGRAEENVAHRGNQSGTRDKGPADADTIRDKRDEHYHDPAQQVGRCGKAVGLNRAERPHFGDDRGHEERK